MPLVRIERKQVRRVLKLRVPLQVVGRMTVFVVVIVVAVVVVVMDGRGGGREEQRRPRDRWGTSLRRTGKVVVGMAGGSTPIRLAQ